VINSSTVNNTSGADSYTDLNSLNSIRELGRKDKGQALDKIAQQFESMMVRMMMKSMRAANDVFAEGNFLSSNEGDMYQDMYDDQLALSLSQGRGMGVAEVMVRQLQQRFGAVEKPEANTEVTGYLAKRNNYAGVVPAVSSKMAVTAMSAADTNGFINTADTDSKAEDNMVFDGSSEAFVKQLYGMADSAADSLGVDPAVLIAQAALETGWGKKITGLGDKTSFNLFNIKADSRWQGDSISVPTLEVRNGTAVREIASFRAYDSPQHSFDDYVDFIKTSPRYEQALKAKDSEAYARALSEAGYATDPDYSEKIIRILNSKELQSAAQID